MESTSTRWFVVAALVMVWLANEAVPVVFGKSTWDWGFVYVTMRWMVLPAFALTYIVSVLFTTLDSRRFDIYAVLRCGMAVTVICFCWIYQYFLFIPR